MIYTILFNNCADPNVVAEIMEQIRDKSVLTSRQKDGSIRVAIETDLKINDLARKLDFALGSPVKIARRNIVICPQPASLEQLLKL